METKRPDKVSITLGDLHADVENAMKKRRARNVSALVRDALRAYLHGEHRTADVRPLVAAVDKLRSDLSRVGSNLNQLAHGFNMRGPVAFNRDALAVAHDELRAEFRRIADTLDAIDGQLRARARR